LVTFLITATAISLSGVLAPGPMTAATLAAGTRSRHAGAIIALGHGAVEFPLMLVIIAGAGQFFELEPVRLGIGLAGGLFLLLMGAQLLMAARSASTGPLVSDGRHPFVIGIILSGGNPYFLIWWATVGLALATEAVGLGILAFALFALVHWLCDLVWLEALSLASHKGTELLGGRLQQIVLVICGLLLLGFGGNFLYDAGRGLLG
jgi:threonine/homoserine/homoserine lactone efflux protein